MNLKFWRDELKVLASRVVEGYRGSFDGFERCNRMDINVDLGHQIGKRISLKLTISIQIILQALKSMIYLFNIVI